MRLGFFMRLHIPRGRSAIAVCAGFIAATLTFPVNASGQRADSLATVFHLSGPTVVATRYPVEAADAPGLVVSIDAQSDADIRGAETLAHLLAREGGFPIRTY